MIQTGNQAPDFTLDDQFGRKVASRRYRENKHVLLLFYPLDFTPT